jgi:hypothetical protein
VRVILTQLPLALERGQENFDTVLRAVEKSDVVPEPGDLLLLPELVDLRSSRRLYESSVARLARRLGCHVVGGTHRHPCDGGLRNAGIAVAPDGSLCSRYEKCRPYGGASDAQPGVLRPPFRVAEWTVRVLVCADFWHANLWLGPDRPDLVLVAALSVSRKPRPEFARGLWRNMAIARAYEFGALVGISDWAHPFPEPSHPASGVGGLADPTTADPRRFFRPVGPSGIRAFELDRRAVARLRADCASRAFLHDRDGQFQGDSHDRPPGSHGQLPGSGA